MTARDVLAQLRLADGRLWVDAAVDFQLADARAVLDGPEPYSFLTRARGASKTSDLAGLALSLLLAAGDAARLYWLAADADQGALAVDSIAGYMSRTPALGALGDVQARRVVVPATGARLDVLAADAPSAWGLNPDALFVDELANWANGPAARRLWEAASSAVAKRSDARLCVLTTAGSPDHFSRKVLDHALTSPLWRVHEVRGPAPWADPDRVEEQRQRLPHAVFAQLFLNEWTQAEGSFLDPAVIDAAFTLEGPALERSEKRGSYVAALDLGAVNDRTVFAIGHREGTETVHLDRMQTWQGSRAHPVNFSEVEDFIVTARRRFNFKLRLDPWQGLDLAQRLRAKGIVAEEFHFNQGSKQRLAQTLLHSLNAGHLRLYEAEGLRDELLALRLKQSASGSWSFDHQTGGHDDRAVVLALMTVAALEGPTGTSGPPIVLTKPSRWHLDGGRRRDRFPSVRT
ncbi:MAG TPA: hypothetical protein VFI03_12250 [Solirubrobacterales bacterium]|nr:hypothetical protein [Solirubrobacterales bacterium]